MWYSYTVTFYSAVKDNEVIPSAGERIELETITQRKQTMLRMIDIAFFFI